MVINLKIRRTMFYCNIVATFKFLTDKLQENRLKWLCKPTRVFILNQFNHGKLNKGVLEINILRWFSYENENIKIFITFVFF